MTGPLKQHGVYTEAEANEYYKRLKRDEELAEVWISQLINNEPVEDAAYNPELAGRILLYMKGDRALKDEIFNTLLEGVRDYLEDLKNDEPADDSEEWLDRLSRARDCNGN
jgi:hypothetical protein